MVAEPPPPVATGIRISVVIHPAPPLVSVATDVTVPVAPADALSSVKPAIDAQSLD